MSTQQLFIPDKINVGFQSREDTYTKKLAYVIYYDQKGVLRKEKSWNSWRDEKIPSVEFTNTPEAGFVLNKGVGGARRSYGWNARNEYIRVYDPRDFEFEISVANLLFILRECDCNKGKGLEGKFVYAWDGTELVLLPEGSQEYQNSKKFTGLQSLSVKSKELIKGASYTTKDQRVLIYLGRFDYYCVVDIDSWRKPGKGHHKKHIFWNGKNFIFLDNIKTIATLNSEIVASDYAELVDKYYQSVNGSRPVELFTKEIPPTEPSGTGWTYNYFVIKEGSTYKQYRTSNYNGKKEHELQKLCEIQIVDNDLTVTSVYHSHYYNSHCVECKNTQSNNDRLYIRLESGSEFKIIQSNLTKGK